MGHPGCFSKGPWDLYFMVFEIIPTWRKYHPQFGIDGEGETSKFGLLTLLFFSKWRCRNLTNVRCFFSPRQNQRMSREMASFQKEMSSSKHQFSGDMFVFRVICM